LLAEKINNKEARKIMKDGKILAFSNNKFLLVKKY
tara:strand:+ start:330 stop:434 length:105 start_codon:yes stop_codon:yes gene_type:complete